jgi:putative transcriptional regulator
MSETAADDRHLTGQLLVAMPGMADPRFARSVVFLCAHSPEGAMGIVVNRRLDNVSFADIAGQVGIDPDEIAAELPVHFGGPVEPARGFVLHSADHVSESSLVVDGRFALTATIEMLKTVARGEGPKHRLLALGYAGWAPGQLDAEIQANGWLVVPADPELVFSSDNDGKWTRALRKIGIDPSLLSTHMGHA